jgi:lysophospholipase L1-like esterase
MKAKIICLGDSITWGYPYGPEYSWVKISSHELGIPMENRGINGETADDLARRFDRDVAARVPSHVFIMAGTNDASIGIPLQKYSDSILKLGSLSIYNEITPIFGLPVPSADRWLEHKLEKYRIWLKGFATANKLPNPECYMDEVHPSKMGYRAMAACFTKYIKQVVF